MSESWWNKRMAGVKQHTGYTDDFDTIKKFAYANPNHPAYGINNPNINFSAKRGEGGAYWNLPTYHTAQRKPEQPNQRMTNEEIAEKAKAYGFKFDEGGDVPMMDNRKPSKVTQKDRYGNTITKEYEPEMKPFDPTALAIAMMEQGESGGIEMPSMAEPPHPGGPKGTDTVPAWLTPGEFVVNAEAMRIPGAKEQIKQINDQGRAMQEKQGGSIPAGGPQMLSGGGPANPFPPGTYAYEQFEKGRPGQNNYTPPPVNMEISPDAGSTSRQSGGYGIGDGILDLLTAGALGFNDGGPVPFLAGERLNMPQYQDDGGWITDELLDKLAEVESGGNNDAVSPVGAIGKYQWMPKSAAKAGYGVESFDPKDEKKARAATAKYLKNMQKHHGFTPEETLRAYNWGPGNVINHKKGKRKDIPDEALNYAGKILGAENIKGVTPQGDDVMQALPTARPGREVPMPVARPEQEQGLLSSLWDMIKGPKFKADGGAIYAADGDPIPSNTRMPGSNNSNVVPELTDVSKGHQMFGGDTNIGGEKVPPKAPAPVTVDDHGGDGQTIPSEYWRSKYDETHPDFVPQIGKSKITSTKSALDKAQKLLDESDPTDTMYDTKIDNVKNLKNELADAETKMENKKAAQAMKKDKIDGDDKAAMETKSELLMAKLAEAQKNGDEQTADLLMTQIENLEKKKKFTPDEDNGETKETKKTEISKEIVDKTKEDAKEVKQDPDEIVNKGKTASNKEKSEALGFLKDLGLDSLFDKKELARMAVMYAGSRLLGNSHDGSLGWAANNYINRVDTKEANIQALLKAGKYSPASIQAYKESGDASDLMPKGVKPEMSGEFKSFWSPGGKKVRAQKVTVGKSKYWVGPDGKKINQTFESDPSKVKNTPEYNDKVKADSKHYTGMIKGLRETFGTTEVKDGKDLFSTDLVPAVSGNNIAKWATAKGVPATEMGNIITNAYHDAIAHSRNTGEKVKNIEPFLNNQYVIAQVGDASLFQDANGQTADAVKVSSLFKRVQNVANEKGKRLTNIEAVKVYRAAWSKLPQEDKDKWNSKADVKQTGYNGFMKFIQSDLNDGVMNAK